MDSILIKPTKKGQLEFLKDMASKMGFDIAIISEEQREDVGLLKAMLESKDEEIVSNDMVMKKLHDIADK